MVEKYKQLKLELLPRKPETTTPPKKEIPVCFACGKPMKYKGPTMKGEKWYCATNGCAGD